MSKGNSYSNLRYKGLISDQQYKNIKQGQKALKAIELMIDLDKIYPNSEALDEVFAIIREQVGIEPYTVESEK